MKIMTKNNLTAFGPFVMSLLDSAVRAVAGRIAGNGCSGPPQPHEVTVSTDLGRLRSDVVEATAYTSVKGGTDSADFDRRTVCENDFPLLDSYRREAQRILSVHLCRYLPMWSEDNNMLKLRLSASSDFKSSFVQPLADSVHAYLFHSLLARWYGLTADTPAAAASASRAEQAVGDIIGILAYRLRPLTRRMPPI